MGAKEVIKPEKSPRGVVLFDGVCNLCNGLVIFIIKRDPRDYFRFAPLQSPVGEAMAARSDLPPGDRDTVVLQEGERVYTQSTAALRVFRRLHRAWPLFYAFILVPRPLRDLVYRWVARNRYRWFGKKEQCMVPQPGYSHRFLK